MDSVTTTLNQPPKFCPIMDECMRKMQSLRPRILKQMLRIPSRPTSRKARRTMPFHAYQFLQVRGTADRKSTPTCAMIKPSQNVETFARRNSHHARGESLLDAATQRAHRCVATAPIKRLPSARPSELCDASAANATLRSSCRSLCNPRQTVGRALSQLQSASRFH